MSSNYRWLAFAAAVFAFAAPMSAQQIVAAEPSPTPPTASLWSAASIVSAPGLDLASGPVPVVADESTPAPFTSPVPAMGQRQSVALMIVGGAGLLVGSIIGGDSGKIIMVGGGVAGLIGLYHYLR